ncbi:unnamed protein product [Diamesa hyperborea]
MVVILIVLIVGAFYLFYKWSTSTYDYFEKRGMVFSKPLMLVGSSINMFTQKESLAETINNWYKEFRNEKINGFFEFREPVLFVRCPKMLKQLAVKEFDNFVDHRAVINGDSDPMFTKSLVSLTGHKWRDMRATLSPAFTGSKMRQMFEFVTQCGKQSAETIKQQIQSGNDNIFEFKTLATKFTVDVIASCAFGIEVNSFSNPDNDFHKIAQKVTNFASFKNTMKFAGFFMAPKLMNFLKIRLFDKDINDFFNEAIMDTMKIREQKNITRNDMINLLMQAKKGNLTHSTKDDDCINDGFATVEESNMGKSKITRVWDDEDLAAQCFIFFLAGFDTVSTTMSFAAHELAVNSDIQDKLLQEVIDTNTELNGEPINYEKIQKMKYMDAFICETLRKWPAAPVTDRICVKDFELKYDEKTFLIEKGTTFYIPIWSLHHDPLYFPDPDKFDPERFNDENRGNIDADTYLPFGIGPRNCIGSRFALMEMKTIIYYLLLNFKFEVTAKTQIPLQYAKTQVALKTERGVWVALVPREA